MAIKAPHPLLTHRSLLGGLKDDEHRRFLADLQRVEYSFDQIIFNHGELIEYIYFLENAVISQLLITDDGQTIEIGMIGSEGLVGVSALLGNNRATHWSRVLVPGSAWRLSVHKFRGWLQENEPLYRRVAQFYQSLIFQYTQRAACNACHSVKQRLCVWLLMLDDRLPWSGLALPLTHELISQRVSVRRATISVAAMELKDDGLIEYSRSSLKVVDRPALEAAACECYQVLKLGGAAQPGRQYEDPRQLQKQMIAQQAERLKLQKAKLRAQRKKLPQQWEKLGKKRE